MKLAEEEKNEQGGKKQKKDKKDKRQGKQVERKEGNRSTFNSKWELWYHKNKDKTGGSWLIQFSARGRASSLRETSCTMNR